MRLDCFEQCNGPAQAAKAKGPTGAGLHFLAQLKGLDVHCAADAAASVPGLPGWVVAALPPQHRRAAPAAGFGARDYPPPRRG